MRKNIVLISDGTWNNEQKAGITNPAKLHLILDKHGLVNTPKQLVFYDEGVGTEGGGLDRLWGGATGEGVEKNICDLYGFLVKNYEPGDRIFLFGFSRGAATVRYVAGMIRDSGILKKHDPRLVRRAFQAYGAYDGFDDPTVVDFRKKYSHKENEIAFLGVWDTVESHFFPEGYFEPELPSNVRVARHALAVDERRKHFRATLWDPRPETDSEQRWFPGVHCDAGGSYQHHGISDATYLWVLKAAEKHGLRLPKGYIDRMESRRHKTVVSDGERSDLDTIQPNTDAFDNERDRQAHVAPNPLDKKHKSYKKIYLLLGYRVRTIGEKADEVVDSSVVVRMKSEGNHYKPKNLPPLSDSFWSDNKRRIRSLKLRRGSVSSSSEDESSGYSDHGYSSDDSDGYSSETSYSSRWSGK